MSDVDIVLKLAVENVDKVYSLSNALQQLNRAIEGSVNPMRNLGARSKALSAAVGSSDSSLKNHAKSVEQLARNSAILSNELGRVKKEIQGLGTSYKFGAKASTEFKNIAVRDLKQYEQALKGIRLRALVEDLKSVSQEQKRLGKDAQFVGRSLIIGLTTPIMTFSRVGLQSLVAIDREFVRLNKVLEGVAPNLELAAKKMGVDLKDATAAQNAQMNQLVSNYEKLDSALSKTSIKFGLAKSLTVGLAGDFAELGIQTTDNIALITELTAKTEKLGNMDIGAAKDLVQSLYFQAQRALQQTDAGRRMTFQERETAAIKAATAQLNLFNSVENVTALTLRDLGDAFPEVAAAATSFGLSMTEAAALLAPMKAAGFETGASANSIKVSLQRLTAPTKQNAEMFKELTRQYNVNFNAVKGTGLDAIQQLVDGFNTLKDSAAGQEGAMEFFAKVFGVRQGPRMEVAIAQMAEFDRLLKNNVIPSTTSAEKRLQEYANTAIISANRTSNANLPIIRSFKDIGIIARTATASAGQEVEGLTKRVTQEQINAAKAVRKELSKEIVKAQREGGEDLIGQVGTEAGRAMFIELAGSANAAEIAQRELEASLGALDTQLSILKNNFKTFAAELITGLKPTIEKITDLSTKLYNAWDGLDAQTKKLVSTVALAIAGITAAVGPLIFVFGQFRLAIGSVGKVLFGFLPGLKTMTIEAAASSQGLLKLTKPLTVVGDTVVNTNTKFATFIATMSSGTGPMANFARKLGETTGILQKTTTAPLAITQAVVEQKGDTGIVKNLVSDKGLYGVDPVTGAPAPSLGARLRSAMRLQRTGVLSTAAGVRGPGGTFGPMDPSDRDMLQKIEKMMKDQLLGKGYAPVRGGRGAGGRFARSVDDLVEQAVRLQAGGVTSAAAGIRAPSGRFRTMTTAERDALTTYEQTRETLTKRSVAQRALSRKDIGLDIFTDQRTFKGRDISAERASDIYRGGIRGGVARTSEAIARAREAAPGRIADLGTRARGLATAPVNAFTKSITGANTAVFALRQQHLAAGVEAPRVFARMSAAVKGFATATSIGTKAIKLLKMTLIASGIGIIILSIGVAIMLIMKNMDQFKEGASKGIKVVGQAFNIVKNAVMELIRPVIDLFASFGDGSDGAGGAVSGLGNIFNSLANVLKFVAEVFSWLVTTIIQPYLYVIINIVKFVISLFTGKWTEALKALGAAFGGAFALIGKIVLELMAFLVKQVINIIFEIPAAFIKAWAWGIEKATDLFFGFAEFVIKQLKRIPGIGRFLGNIGSGVLSGLRTARDAFVGTVRTVGKAIDGAGDTIKRGIDKGVDSATKAMDKLGKGGVKRSKGKLDLFGGKDENSVEVDTDDAQEQIANATGTGMEEGADEGVKALAQRVKDIKKEVQQEIAERIKDSIQSVVEKIQETLKSQKEASLKIYDDQIAAIEDVGKAESRLTKRQEYENKLREAEAERSLNRLNSRRSYALAVYSGQIDEARNIADQAAAQEIKDNEKITGINEDRAREVAEQNRSDLIDSIKKSKEEASKYFDEMIKSFTDAAKKITEFPPTTAEEFNTMLNQLIEGGGGFVGARNIANSMGTVFSDSFRGALSNLGVNASGPLTSSLEAISKTLTDNNPFGPEGVWNKTIDASINALTRKYQGLTNTLTTIIDTKSEAFQKLVDIYNQYQNLVETGSATGGAGGGDGGGGTKPRTSKPATQIAAPIADLFKIRSYTNKYLEDKYGSTAEGKKMVASIKNIVGNVAMSSVLLGSPDAGFKDYMPIIMANRYKDQIETNAKLVYAYIVSHSSSFMKTSGVNQRAGRGLELGFFKGGMPYAMGGPTKGPIQQGIPAILHGGEYVVRNSAVKKYGWGMMQQINQGTYKPKPYAVGGMVSNIWDKDKAQKEWEWQQKNGGFSAAYMNAIGTAETGDAWKNKGPQWKTRRETSHGWMGGGLAIADPTWIDYGGKEFAPTAELATALQQMVVKNRISIFGYMRKIKPGKTFPAGTTSYNPPLGTGGHSFNRAFKSDNKSRIPLPENFNENISLLSQIGKISKSYGSENNAFANKEARDAYVKYFTKKPRNLNIITMPFTGEKIYFIGKGTSAKIVNPDLRFADFATNSAGYAIGGLVKGNKTSLSKGSNTSAAQFAKANYISNFDIQKITYSANQATKKKNIFQKIASAIASPFKAIKNLFKKEVYGAMYGTGTGTSDSYADTFRAYENATKDANIFNLTGEDGYEAMPGSVLGIKSLRSGLKGLKAGMDFTPSGAFSSAYKMADPNKSMLSRIGWGTTAGLGIAGNTTIFAPNSGYLTGSAKAAKSSKFANMFAAPSTKEKITDKFWNKYNDFMLRHPFVARLDLEAATYKRMRNKDSFYTTQMAVEYRELKKNLARLMNIKSGDQIITDDFNETYLARNYFKPHRTIAEEMLVNRYMRKVVGINDKEIYPTLPRILSRKLTAGVPFDTYLFNKLKYTKEGAKIQMAIDEAQLLKGQNIGAKFKNPFSIKTPMQNFEQKLINSLLGRSPVATGIGKTSPSNDLYNYAYQSAFKNLIRQRVLANISKSKEARLASNFKKGNIIEKFQVPEISYQAWLRSGGREGSGIRDEYTYFEYLLSQSNPQIRYTPSQWSHIHDRLSLEAVKQRENAIYQLMGIPSGKRYLSPAGASYFDRFITQSFGSRGLGTGPIGPDWSGTFAGAFDLAEAIRIFGIPIDTSRLYFRGVSFNDASAPWVSKLINGELSKGDVIPHLSAVRTSGNFATAGTFSGSGSRGHSIVFAIEAPRGAKAAFSRSYLGESEALLPGLSELIVANKPIKLGENNRYIVPVRLKQLFDRDNFDINNFKKIGNQQGYNPGGIYQSAGGSRFYIKQAASSAAAINEEMASKIYSILRIQNAGQRVVYDKNKIPYLISMMVDEISPLQKFAEAYPEKITEQLAIHAWLGNYDIIGTKFDNLGYMDDNYPFVIDAGASLLHRGTGGLKAGSPFEFTDDAVQTLTDLVSNPRQLLHASIFNANTVFGRMTHQKIVESVLKLNNRINGSYEYEDIVKAIRATIPGAEKQDEMITLLWNRFESLRKAYIPNVSNPHSLNDWLLPEDFFRSNMVNKNIPLDTVFNGGLIRGFANGGFVSAFASQGVPAMLHGGEYVVNSSAVRNLGISALEAINNMRFNAPKNPSYSGAVQPQTTSTSTVHIYVDNFIGEKQWFESMMKDYNINVAPQNQKAAGLNNTTISTYKGINRGL